MYNQMTMKTASLQKMQKMGSVLPSTCYGSSKDIIMKYVTDLIMNYDTLDFRVITQISAPTSRVFEIYGNIPISYQGATYYVILSVVLPQLFPNTGPIVSFVNPDTTRFRAIQKYDVKKNPDGKSYLIQFSEITNWTAHKNILRVLSQICTEFSKEYPLYEMTNVYNPPTFGSNTGSHGQFNNGFMGQNTSQTNLGTNYGNNFNQNTNLFGNNTNQWGQNTNDRDQLLAKIKKKYFDESMGIAKKMESDLNVQRTNMVELQTMYLKLLDEETKMTKFENDAPLLISDLFNKVSGLKAHIQSNETTSLTGENISFVLTEADEKSRVLIELVSNNKAIEDLNVFLENQFKADKVELDTLLKHYKDNSDKEFFNKHLIKKLTSA